MMNEHHRGNKEIIVKNVSKNYLIPDTGKTLEVLIDISFEVAAGSILSIIGPSGCGKSTLLRIIAGLLESSKGEVIIENIDKKESSIDKILVFQDLHLFNWMTVYKNIEFAFLTRDKKKEDVKQEIDKIIELVNLKGFENYYPQEISGGMRQRLALARALGAAPSVLLLDEPFSSLDAGTKIEMEMEFLNIVKSNNITTILVTHDIRQALFLSDKLIVLTRRPAIIHETINFKSPYPRNNEISETAAFRNLEISLSKMLR